MILQRIFFAQIFIALTHGAICRFKNEIYKHLRNEFNIEFCNYLVLNIGETRKTIEYLRASGNLIKLLEDKNLAGATELIEIDLSRNRISEISCDAFKDQAKLTDLNLNYNLLKRLTPGIFDPLTSFESLKVEGNNLMIVEDQLFSQNSKLSLIVLSSNQIVAISDKCFTNIKPNALIDLSGSICFDSKHENSKDSVKYLDKCFSTFENLHTKIAEYNKKHHRNCKDLENYAESNSYKTIFISALSFFLIILILSIFAFYFLRYKPRKNDDFLQPYDTTIIRSLRGRSLGSHGSVISHSTEGYMTNGENRDDGLNGGESEENPSLYAVINRGTGTGSNFAE